MKVIEKISSLIGSGRAYSKRFYKMLIVPAWLSERKIDFIICGVQKGGTTALDAYLRGHPGIGMADTKEVHFFDDELINKLSDKYKYRYYHSFFTSYSDAQCLGEATPIYIWWKDVMQRIYQYNSHIKLIVLLRSPIERAYSHWNMECQRGAEQRPFSQVIREETSGEQHRVYSYVDRGFYAKQLQQMFSLFPRNQVLCLRQDELQCNPEKVLTTVTRFLGINELRAVKNKKVHSRNYESPISASDFEYLIHIFRNDINSLEKILNWNLSDWLKNKNNDFDER